MKDNNGLLWFNESSKGQEIEFIIPGTKQRNSTFYEFIDNPNFIIKKESKDFNREELLYMLSIFNDVNDNVIKTDLPTMYYKENDLICGSIVPYYGNSKTLYEISKTKKLEKLMEVYKKDDDVIHNLFMLQDEILDIMEELFDNNICYYDSNSTNFVFKDGNVHLIDFDPKYIYFDQKRRHLYQTLLGLDTLFDKINNRLLSYDEFPYIPRSFNGFRKHLVKIENKVRKM